MFWLILGALCSAQAQESPSDADSAEEGDGPGSEQSTSEPASAEPSASDLERGKELYDNGRLLFDEASYRDAIVAWEEAYRLTGRHTLLFNIANAHERLADYDGAIDVLNRYRAFATADEREAIERRLRNLEKLKADLEERTRAAEPGPEPVAAAPAPVPASAPLPAPVSEPMPAPEPVKKRRGGRTAAGVTLIGVGVAALGAGAGLGLAARSARNQASESCVGVEGGNVCSSDAKDDLAASRQFSLLADTGFVVGALSTGVGVVVLATSPRGKLTVGTNTIRFDGTF